jgi:hypothetical protein
VGDDTSNVQGIEIVGLRREHDLAQPARLSGIARAERLSDLVPPSEITGTEASPEQFPDEA